MRRERIPRPIVCKSNDPYEDWPNTVLITWSWFYDDGNGPTSDFGTETIPRTRLQQNYVHTGVDNEGAPFTLNLNLPLSTQPPFSPICAITVTILGGPQAGKIWTGVAASWDGSRPWTTGGQVLYLDPDNPVGDWVVDIL